MKRGFEENVPRVRPRVRLGRALDGTGDESEAAFDEDVAQETPPQLELAPPMPDRDPPRAFEPAAAPLPSPARSEPAAEAFHVTEQRKPADPRPVEAPPRAPRRAMSPAAEVAQLAKDLTSELAQAAEANKQLRADLDAAVTALRRAPSQRNGIPSPRHCCRRARKRTRPCSPGRRSRRSTGRWTRPGPGSPISADRAYRIVA